MAPAVGDPWNVGVRNSSDLVNTVGLKAAQERHAVREQNPRLGPYNGTNCKIQRATFSVLIRAMLAFVGNLFS